MRRPTLPLVAVLVLAQAGSAQAATTNLHTNRLGCRSYQDMIDFIRLGQQAKNDDTLMEIVIKGMFDKIANSTCHQFTAGTPVTADETRTEQGEALICLRAAEQDHCFWALGNHP